MPWNEKGIKGFERNRGSQSEGGETPSERRESQSKKDIIFQSIEGIVNSPNLKKDDISNFLKSIGIKFFTRSIDEIQLRMYELSKNDPNYLKKVEEKLKQFCSKKIDKIQELLSNMLSSGKINSEQLKSLFYHETVFDFVVSLRRDFSLDFNKLDEFEGMIKNLQNFQEELNGEKIKIRTKVDERVSFIMSNLEALNTDEEKIAFLVENMGISVSRASYFVNEYYGKSVDQKNNMIIDELRKQKQEALNKAKNHFADAKVFLKDYNDKISLSGEMRKLGSVLLDSGSTTALFGFGCFALADTMENKAKEAKDNHDNSVEEANQCENQADNFQRQIDEELNSPNNENARSIIRGAVILEGKNITNVDNLIEAVGKLTYSADNIIGLKNELKQKLQDVDINNFDNQFALFTMLDPSLKTSQSDDQTKLKALLYSILIDGIDVESDDDVNIFIRTVQGEETKYSEKYRAYCDKMNQVEDNIITEIATNTLIERYKAAERLAEIKKVYGEFISFFPSDKSEEGNSYIIAENLAGGKGKLNHYRIRKLDRTDDEEKALQYTAFNVTFNNIFNMDDPIVQKLANQNINLRDDLSRNGIYYQDTNQFNEEARNNYIQSEKFLSAGLTTEEISSLSESLKNLPEEVKSNYEILSGNFDADQGSFEEIAKIYALGEIINNIRNYFENNKENPQLKNIVEGLELDENEPAKIEGDCLYLKGKINGTVTNIKYDLRTGKLFMNSFLQKVDGKERFVIGNNEPTTEIGNLNSFQDILDGYKSNSFIQLGEESSESTDSSQMEDDNSDTQNKNNEQTLKYLTENKLIQDLGYIKEVVINKSKEQGTKNNFIDKFLKTFNMLPGSGNAKIDIDGGSSLYNFLESIKNTEDQRELEEFSFEMPELMECCGFNWGNNIENPKEVSFSLENLRDSEKNFVQSIQESINQFFNGGEKNNIENNKNGYFNGSFNLSFAGVFLNSFCKKEGAGWKLNTTEMGNFVKTLKDCSNSVLTAYDACENSEVSYGVKDSDLLVS